MKKLSSLIILLCGLLVFSGTALALTINTDTYVGQVDTIEDSTYIHPPSTDAELTWIQGVLGDDYFISEEYSVTAGNWTQTNENQNAYALELPTKPTYYYIWLASQPNIEDPDYRNAFLYLNQDSLYYAVVDITKWLGYTPPEDTEINIGRISHIRDITAVPEPGTLLLLGTGLFGLAIASRRKLLK